jgi:endonuclease YncB( thermonuclease family)
MIKILCTIVTFLSVTISLGQTVLTGKVIAIKDGDTVVVIDSLNRQTTLRLAEVDCPEKNQPFGTKSKQFTSDQVYLKTVKYVITDTDRYGRSIAMIYYDNNKYLSAEIIRAGMGWHYKKYSKSVELAEIENEAKKEKHGLWIDEKPISPKEWRKTN